MTKIGSVFELLQKRREAAYIPFLTIGFPTLEKSRELVHVMVKGGADLIELGVPFSDPLADGPTIQAASQIALRNGVTVKKSLAFVKSLRDEGVSTPILLMGYANPFLAHGIEALAQDAAAAGVDGFIIPDLPVDEATDWLAAFSRRGLNLIFFIAPTTSPLRAEKILAQANGFLYCISISGVTGARDSLPENLTQFLQKIRLQTKLPLCVGFGLATSAHVAQVSKDADGAIVASAIINLLNETPESLQAETLKTFIENHKAATKKV
jgi:tryptophan synthase alpha chain